MLTIATRPATSSDVETIAAFQTTLAFETESKILDHVSVLYGVRGAVEGAYGSRYLVAEIAGEVVGCLMLLPEWSDWSGHIRLWVHSVFVTESARRCGVAKAMIAAAEKVAASLDADGLRLVVNSNNLAAIRLYESFAFVNANYRVMDLARH